MKDIDKFIPDEERPVMIEKEKATYIREGRMENAVKAFRRPAYPNMRKERK